MKKKNVSKKKKIKISRIILIFIILLVIGFGLYFFLNTSDEESRLTLIEKQWIEKNKDTLIDFAVPNNLTILGENGEGTLFDFVKDIEKDTGLRFNKVSYNYPLDDVSKYSFGLITLRNTDELKASDILVTEDSYVLLGINDGYISNLSILFNTNIGILESDKGIVDKALGANINFKSYGNRDELYKALENKSIDYIIVPRYANMDYTIEKGFNVKYSFNNISNKIVLRLGSNERLNNIVSKYLESWLVDDFRDSKEESLMKYFVSSNIVSDVDRSTLTNKVYKYGFVKNTAYNVYNNNLYGVAGEYINTLEDMADMDFDYVQYKNKDELIKGLNNNKVDIAFINFNYNSDKTIKSESPFRERMAVLANDYVNISDKRGLNNQHVYAKPNNYLYDYLKDNYNCVLKSNSEIHNNNLNNGLLVLDEVDYLYNEDKYNDNYKLLFVDDYMGDYHFEVIAKDEVLVKLLDFVINNTDYNEFKNLGVNGLLSTLTKENSFKNVYIVILVIVLAPIILALLFIVINKNIRKTKVMKKEDVLKYNDMLTSLKNRNYLNDNIEKWDDTKIYPRTVIIIDLNNLKYVNDNYGHQEGNELIKKAATILINTQLEKSEIVRSDGNEFLIYLIGYNKNQISTYISKLSKEFEKLPYGFGAAMGYSMIEDEITTMDDAINEATIEMRMDKEQNYK